MRADARMKMKKFHARWCAHPNQKISCMVTFASKSKNFMRTDARIKSKSFRCADVRIKSLLCAGAQRRGQDIGSAKVGTTLFASGIEWIFPLQEAARKSRILLFEGIGVVPIAWHANTDLRVAITQYPSFHSGILRMSEAMLKGTF